MPPEMDFHSGGIGMCRAGSFSGFSFGNDESKTVFFAFPVKVGLHLRTGKRQPDPFFPAWALSTCCDWVAFCLRVLNSLASKGLGVARIPFSNFPASGFGATGPAVDTGCRRV